MNAGRSWLLVAGVVVAVAGVQGAATVASAAPSPAPTVRYGPASYRVAAPATESTATLPTVTGLTIVPAWDTSVTSSSQVADVEQAFATAAAFFESHYYDPVTVKIAVGYGEVDGMAMSGGLGESLAMVVPASYSAVRSALVAGALTADQQSAAAALPDTAPFGSGSGLVPAAEAMTLGLTSGSDFYGNNPEAGYIGLSDTYPLDFTDPVPTAGSYDPVGTFEHEISEVLGRVMVGDPGNGWYPWMVDNLFRYAPGGSGPATSTASGDFLSADGGVSSQVLLSTVGDPGDYADPNPDAFNAVTTAGQADPVTAAGLTNMDLLGYHSVPLTTLTVTPSATVAHPGSTVMMTAELVTDRFGSTSSVDVTSGTSFTITGAPSAGAYGSSCSANACMLTAPGTYTITGTYPGVTPASATVTLTDRP